MQKNLLIIGAGGREHALAFKFSQDSRIARIFVAPGNAGTALMEKCENVALDDIDALLAFAKTHDALTVVGSEALLAEGIVDKFQAAGLAIFGPQQAAARLEYSKAFAKAFMQKYGVKTADYQTFDEAEKALAYLRIQARFPTVIKADGLAAGKGVIIAKDLPEAEKAIDEIMAQKMFGAAGHRVVIEQFLTGVEASILSFTDGKTILPLFAAKDHKKIGEGETGLNTGGMGVICPNPFVTDAVEKAFMADILHPTLKGLQAENLAFAGVIFFGLMINDEGVYLLEYNMRMGDPETQAVLPLLENALYDVIDAALHQSLASVQLKWKEAQSVCVVAVAKGYPEAYEKGQRIEGIEKLDDDVLCFIAGAKLTEGALYTNGGRVLNVVATGATLAGARMRAYENLKRIQFDGMYYRHDIGLIE